MPQPLRNSGIATTDQGPDNAIERLREHMRALRQDLAAQQSNKDILQREASKLEPMFKEVLPIGTAVVIDLETFGFVYSPNRVAALLQSIEVFGAHSPGFSFDIGRPLYLSGLQSIR